MLRVARHQHPVSEASRADFQEQSDGPAIFRIGQSARLAKFNSIVSAADADAGPQFRFADGTVPLDGEQHDPAVDAGPQIEELRECRDVEIRLIPASGPSGYFREQH